MFTLEDFDKAIVEELAELANAGKEKSGPVSGMIMMLAMSFGAGVRARLEDSVNDKEPQKEEE